MTTSATFQERNPVILTGSKRMILFTRIWGSVLLFIVKKYKNPRDIFRLAKGVNRLKTKYTKEKKYHNKIAFVDGRAYFNCNNVGWPAKHFNRLIDLTAREALSEHISNLENLRMVQIAFTKKCPLNCEHCYEGEELNKKDVLTLEDHKKIVKKLQDAGIPMIHFGGGDPMAKVDDLIEILNSAKGSSDFWVFTSGFNLNERNTQRLKEAGLTGVSIGLDHYLPELHNRFRRNEKAFGWVESGVRNAKNAGLVVTLTICLTRDFVSEDNLMQYMKQARKWGVSFVQFLDPRAVGNYAGQDVGLLPEQVKLVEEFFLKINREDNYKDMPIILYPGYHQRRTGCSAAGNRYLYIDTNGYMSSCPFCRNTKNHILDDEHERSIREMKIEGCDLLKNQAS